MDSQHPASETLYAYADDGLSEAERRGIERHLGGCTWCQERLAHASDLPRALKARFSAEGAPEALRAAVRAQIQVRPDGPRVRHRRATPAKGAGRADWRPRAGGPAARAGARRVPLAIAVAALGAGVLLLFAAVLIGGRFTGNEQPLLDQLTGAHARMADDRALIQKQGEADVYGAWFQSILQEKIRVPALTGLQVAGGRIDSIEGRPAAHVLYQQNGAQAMSLLVWRGAAPLGGFTARTYEGNQVYVGQQGTTTVILWPDDDLRYACVGAAPPEQMLEIAARVWRAGL
jgi:anti-sigma factor RsiW